MAAQTPVTVVHLHFIFHLAKGRKQKSCFQGILPTSRPGGILTVTPFYSDTIDLQDREAPSAKDHQQAPIPTPNGSLAPHQAETIREVAAETAQELSKSPGVSWTAGDVDLHQYADDLAAEINLSLNGQRSAGDGAEQKMPASQQQDALAIAQNGGISGHDVDDGDLDGDGDDGMDDDMMDKISSSPSIEDGGSPPSLEAVWPRRVDSLRPLALPFPFARNGAEYHSQCSRHDAPLPKTQHQCESKASLNSPCCHHHLSRGRYNVQDRRVSDAASTSSAFGTSTTEGFLQEKGQRTSVSEEDWVEMNSQEPEAIAHDGNVSEEESRVDSRVSSLRERQAHDEAGRDEGIAWIDHETELDTEHERPITRHNDRDVIDDLTIPYEGFDDEDDDGDFSDVDPRFIDYGWDAECLQNTEDIDFEFVYALHTFVATVEGQANATKGDTMVLLDDSNSYWWLVRVVKDSSIGECF